ncbi:hypothetical protein C0Q70_12727 [Pomacea canaliculata]|uniref:Sushi domain-containing protein n=1 Tax=Pomacea canaliculata TaxID=400727 RepID=A0A2T7P2A9_POMCA|nr:hypothetical protein C0Q70_12727 [Pomacea canaliculata]
MVQLDTATYPGCRLLLLLMLSLPTPVTPTSAGRALLLSRVQDAVAIVITTRNETQVRLLTGTPDGLFSHLATSTSGLKYQDLARALITSNEWVAIDSDYDDNLYYVIDRRARSITAISASSGGSYVVYSGISSKAAALSVDWVEDAVYWADPAYDAIFRFKGTGNCRHEACVRTIIHTGLDNPTGVAVCPRRRLLFWTDQGGHGGDSKLERSDLSGDNRVELFWGLHSPSAVTLDHSSHRVYWLTQTGDTSVVESCDFEGQDRYSAVMLTGSEVTALTAWRGLLVMADINHQQVMLHSLTTNITRRLWPGSVTSLTVFAQRCQTPDTSVTGGGDGAKDLVEEGFLLLASEQGGVSILEKTLATRRSPSAAATRHILAQHSVTAMAADVGQGLLYFFDRRQGAIMWLNLGFLRPGAGGWGSEPKARILTRVAGNVDGLAVDWLGKAVYWSDTRLQRLAAVSMDGRHVRCLVCHHVSKPRDIVVHPKRGLVFWVDAEDRDPRVERVRMDGRQRATVVSGGLVYTRPRALTIDFKDDMLYWSDGSYLCRSHVDASALPGVCSATLELSQPAVKSLEILHDYVVWTDFAGNVQVADKDEVLSTAAPPTSSSSSRIVMADSFATDLLYFHLRASQRIPPVSCQRKIDYEDGVDMLGQVMVDSRVLQTGAHHQRDEDANTSVFRQDRAHAHAPLATGFVQTGLAYQVYWADTGVGAISRAYLNGTWQEIVFAHRDIVAETLFLDHRRQLLYFIDTTGHRVGLISLATMAFRIILQSPDITYHDLTGHVTTGTLYLSGVRLTGNSCCPGVIVRSNWDGSDVWDELTGLQTPRGMVLSQDALLWVDSSNKTLNLLNLTTGSSSLLLLLPEWSAPRDLAVLGNVAYWTDTLSPYLSRVPLTGAGHPEELSGSVLFRPKAITSYDSRVHEGGTSDDVDEPSDVPQVLASFQPVSNVISDVMTEKGFCTVPAVPNGRVLNHNEGAYVTSGHVIRVDCYPGYGLEGTRISRFSSECRQGSWITRPACTWAMAYRISEAREGRRGHYVVFTSSTEFAVPADVTYLDALAIGGGGGGMYACSRVFGNLTKAGDGGDSRVGRYLRAGGGRGGSTRQGGRGGFGTVFFGGQGQMSSSCLGGGAAGETELSSNCSLGSAMCPFCGAGGAIPACSLCQHRTGGCRGRKLDADLYGGGATGWAGGGGGGGGGYSRMTIDVTPGEIIPVTVGAGGQPSVGRAGGGVVVLTWDGRLEHVLPFPEHSGATCRGFTWSSQPVDALDDHFLWCNGHNPAREP